MSGDWLALGAVGLLAAAAAGRRGSRARQESPWLSLALVKQAEPYIAAQGVSKVARGQTASTVTSEGFLEAYAATKGSVEAMRKRMATTNTTWAERRQGFIDRHMGQAKANGESLWRGDQPSDRHLGLIAWAYSPDPQRVRRWLAAKGSRDLLPGGIAAGRSSAQFDPDQIKRGIEVELQHTPDRRIAQQISRDHLAQIPDYYTRLAKMEREAKGKGSRGLPARRRMPEPQTQEQLVGFSGFGMGYVPDFDPQDTATPAPQGAGITFKSCPFGHSREVCRCKLRQGFWQDR